MPKPPGTPSYPSGFAMVCFTLLRVVIGWHFLYEGLVKLQDPSWSAAGHLGGAVGPLSGVFHWMADMPGVLAVVNQANIWGLLLIGGCLMLGLAIRPAAAAGMALLALYYLSYPPFIGVDVPVAEGSYLIVNKNLVEMIALLVVVVAPAKSLGLDGILAGWFRRRKSVARAGPAAQNTALTHAEAVLASMSLSRRRVLAGLAGLPVAGAFVLAVLRRRGWESHEPDAISGATTHRFEWTGLEKLKGQMPKVAIVSRDGKKSMDLSRLVLGGNLIGGWAHARDLIYVSKLVKAYHHEQKIFETFQIAEQCGINAIVTNPVLCEVINKYWRETGGKIQFISDSGGKSLAEGIKRSIDAGAVACYTHGGMADSLVARGKIDELVQAFELIRQNGVIAGIGGHRLATIRACVEAGIKPDFWMKTLHHTKYWSATKKRQHDNIWSETPEETIAYMESLPQPWIAFKTLAAGAIRPKVGFQYAFRGGADFICVGMYDFQIVEDANIALGVLENLKNRKRSWRAATV